MSRGPGLQPQTVNKLNQMERGNVSLMQFWMSCERETELGKRLTHFWECPRLRDGTSDSPFQSEGVRVGRREGLRLQLHLNQLITNPNDQGQRTMTFYCITSTLTVSKNRVQRSFKRWMHFAQCSCVSNFIRNRANYSRSKSGRNLPFCGETACAYTQLRNDC